LATSRTYYLRLQGRWRYHLLLRSKDRKKLHAVVDKALALLDEETRSALVIDVDPMGM